MIWFTTLESGYQLLSYMVSRVVSIVGICDYWVLGKIDQTDSCIASQHVLSNRKVNIVVLLFQYPPWPLEPPKQPLPITKTSFIIEKSKKISLPRKIGSLTISLTIVFIISKIVILFLPLWCILHRAHDKICTRISWIKNLVIFLSSSFLCQEKRFNFMNTIRVNRTIQWHYKSIILKRQTVGGCINVVLQLDKVNQQNP